MPHAPQLLHPLFLFSFSIFQTLFSVIQTIYTRDSRTNYTLPAKINNFFLLDFNFQFSLSIFNVSREIEYFLKRNEKIVFELEFNLKMKRNEIGFFLHLDVLSEQKKDKFGPPCTYSIHNCIDSNGKLPII